MTVEGFKFFQDAEGFSAFDINAFLMSQSVTRFDNSTDRDTALSSVLTAGMISYDKATGKLQIYDGSSWIDVATGTLTADHGALTGLADDDHTQYHNDARGDARYYTQSQVNTSLAGYLPLSGGTLTGTLTGTSIVATTGIDAGYVGKSITGAYTYITAWPTDGNWIAVNGDNGYLLLDGNYADDDIYLRSYNSTGNVNIGAAHTNTLTVGNGSATLNGAFTATGNIEAQGNLVVTRPDALMLAGASDNNHKIYSVNAADTGLPWSDGPVLVGHSGWGMYCEQENVWRMGLRGSNSSGVRYGWYNCNLMVGSAPNDSINTHTLRVEGTVYSTGRIYPQNWIQFDQHEGLYSPLNAAHFYPNNGTYGSWKIDGSRGGYNGIHFSHNGGYANLMVRQSDGLIGLYNNGRWIMYGTYADHTRLYYAGSEKLRTQSYGVHIYNELTTTDKVNSYLNSNGQWWGTGLLNNPGSGTAGLALHPGGVAPQLLVAQNNQTVYCRNSVNSAYVTFAAIISNQSSRHIKQDIVPFPSKITTPMGSAVNEEYFQSAIDIANKLRPVFFRLKENDYLDQVPRGRRLEALMRLNKYKQSKGNELYDGPDLHHECGRDCDGSKEDPCLRTKDWIKGKIGFIAQEVGEVIPECADINQESGEFEGLDALAMTAIAIGAIQELTAKVESLEAQLQGA